MEKYLKKKFLKIYGSDCRRCRWCFRAALGYWYQELNKKRVIDDDDSMRGSYLGPKFSNNFIEDKLKSVNAVFKKIDNEDELLSEI